MLHFWLHLLNLGTDGLGGLRRIEQVIDAIERHAPLALFMNK